ncbi:MAG: radical SAM/SPASM domain-containing protein [Acidobacteriota bacterium]
MSSLLSSFIEDSAPSATDLRPNPFVHAERDRLYNPLTDRSMDRSDARFDTVQSLFSGTLSSASLEREVAKRLADDGWLVSSEDEDLSRGYHLKVVSLETNTVCNQACYFCPVSIDPREEAAMSDAMFSRIIDELTAWRSTIEGIFLQSYNEPTLERRFVAQCRAIVEAGLPAAVLSNASGLTPAKVDGLMEFGGLRYLCVNLSTLDRDRYKQERGADHLNVVLRNLDYVKDVAIARQMKIVVLGTGDAKHDHDFEGIATRFGGTRFTVERHVVMDRAGYLEVGLRPADTSRRLRGCDNLGSRPIQHLHITPKGKCLLCCEDYDENYVVGDLTANTIEQVLTGPDLARMRRWTYGIEESPADFICHNCVFARYD